MTAAFLSIAKLERRFATGNVEEMTFECGVNVLVGRPNTGKTKWLQTLDFLLGDPGGNPFEGTEEEGLAEKYDAAAAEIRIGDDSFRIERRWREAGGKGKIHVDDVTMSPKDFQHWLLEKLGIPLVNFPKGNPMSGQTWPELSFRTLLRHIYRQQRFWGGIADLQPDGEQHASLLQFLGLAEHIFTKDYGILVNLRLETEQLKARRDQYGQTLNELARDLLADDDVTVDVNDATVRAAQKRLNEATEALRQRRIAMLERTSEQVIAPERRGRISELGHLRAAVVTRLEDAARKRNAAVERAQEISRYRSDLAEEIERMSRAEDAGAVLADLRITHCPACDQAVAATSMIGGDCFLCHQHLPPDPVIEGLGVVRLRFERDRLAGEQKEAEELASMLEREVAKHVAAIAVDEATLMEIENELTPARQAVAAVAQAEISEIDMALGKASERQRQLERVNAALELETDLTDRILSLEREIAPVQNRVDDAIRSIDFGAAAGHLEDGMNAYLEALNHLRPQVWRHSAVRVDISRREVTMRVGSRRWSTVLGGTDSLYFLMAYHYGLLSLCDKAGYHYPGLAIIDVPGEFSGEAIEDKENFIVQPFIDLLAREEFEGAQLIITGASFTGLAGVHFQRLHHVHVA
jgi:hypothetical protein